MHLEPFSYQMWWFENYFGLFIPLQAEKSSKFKKRRAGTFSIFQFFFHIQSYLIFQKCIWNHFHIKCEDLKAILDFSFAYKKKKVQNSKNVAPGHFQFFRFFSCSILFNICKMHLELFSYQMWRFEKYYGTFIAYKSIENGKSKKSSRRDKNAYLCLPSHLESWIQKILSPVRFHIRMENFLTKKISFKLKLVYKKSVFSKSSRRDIYGGFSTKSKFFFQNVPKFYISPFIFDKA